jgi:uncharacterized LabA/DUF88 family protein
MLLIQWDYVASPRFMIFVDGENLTIRVQDWAASLGLELEEGPLYKRDTFVWIPPHLGHSSRPDLTLWHDEWVGGSPVRSFYYTSVFGSHDLVEDVKAALWLIGFQPEVFKKIRRESKAKGVDIALTKDMLSHAFLGNYEVAILVAGDGDYIPLVEEVKRRGKRVHVAFIDASMSPNLKLASDRFFDLSGVFRSWLQPST